MSVVLKAASTKPSSSSKTSALPNPQNPMKNKNIYLSIVTLSETKGLPFSHHASRATIYFLKSHLFFLFSLSFFLFFPFFPSFYPHFTLVYPQFSHPFSSIFHSQYAIRHTQYDLIIQNEPNFKNAEIAPIPYMPISYDKLSASSAIRNEPKRTQIFC